MVNLAKTIPWFRLAFPEVLLFWSNSSLLHRVGLVVGLGAIHELPGNNLFSEVSLTAFSGSPVFFLQGCPKPLVTCRSPLKLKSSRTFSHRVFQLLPSNI